MSNIYFDIKVQKLTHNITQHNNNFAVTRMDEKLKQIQSYLQSRANPIVQPMLQQMAKQRPDNVLVWIQSYVNKKINQKAENDDGQSQDDEVDEEEFRKKLERVKMNGAKKISRQGISSQVYGQFNIKALFKPKVIQKSQQTSAQILSLLQNSILFQNLSYNDLQTVVNATQINQIPQGQQIITQGEQGDSLYIVSSGQYECHKIINGQNTYLKTYKTGDAFGELSLMYNAPRAATIICKEQGTLYKLDRQTFRNIVQEAAITKRTYYSKILSTVDILSDMDAYQREQVCDALRQEQFAANEYVMKQGENGDRFYIIAEGELIAEKREGNNPVQKVFEYHAGEYFGEIALMKNTVRQASIKTLTPCKLVWIDRNTFKRLLGPLEGILGRNMEKYRKLIDQ